MDKEGQEKIENEKETLQDWVKKQGENFRSADWIRQRYYDKLNITPSQTLEKQQTVEKGEETLNIYINKKNNEIRERYINKLIKQGILKINPTKKYQHLFIFDWDDTLLCTSFLSALHFLDISPQIKEMLAKLDETCSKLLELTTDRGDTYIITNATKGWVEYSSRLYLPKTYEIVGSQKITIMSARSTYGDEFPNDYGRWKIEAFKSILKKINTDLLTNLICMGDSNIEIEAAHCLGQEFDRAVVKTIKFRENPRPEEMIKQLTLVVDKFRQIFDSNKNLTIRLERKK